MITFSSCSSYMCVGLRTFTINHRKLINVCSYKQKLFLNSSFNGGQRSPILFTARCMAGHAKWQNIKHIKAEKDKQKSQLFNKYIRAIAAAVREKGPDPKANNKLANILEEAKKNNVPSSSLESALKRANSKKLQVGTIEMLGPGGFIVIFEYETDNISEMRRNVKIVCRKYGAGIYPGGGGRWRSAYEQKGIIKVTSQLNNEPFDGEKMLDAAIEAGAEDVQKLDENGEDCYEFLCAPEDIMAVKQELEKRFKVEEAFVGYIPMSTVTLDKNDKNIAMSFLNELGDLPDCHRMYENIDY